MPTARPREDRKILAVVLMLVCFLMFTTMDTVVKWLVTAEIPSMQVAFCRYAVHFIVFLLLFFPGERTELFRSNNPRLQILRGLLLLSSTLCNFAALYFLPLTVTTAIAFASPLAVCLLSIPILGEQVGIRRLAAVFVGFLGVLITTQFWGADFHWAMFLSIGTMLTASGYFVLSRSIAGVDNNQTSQIYASGIATMVLLPVAIRVWTPPATALDAVLLVTIGLLGGFGHSLLTLAHRYAPASTLAPLVYVQVIYATVSSWIIFNAPPTFWTIVGTGVIVASGLFIWLRERQLRRPTTQIPTQKGF